MSLYFGPEFLFPEDRILKVNLISLRSLGKPPLSEAFLCHSALKHVNLLSQLPVPFSCFIFPLGASPLTTGLHGVRLGPFSTVRTHGRPWNKEFRWLCSGLCPQSRVGFGPDEVLRSTLLANESRQLAYYHLIAFLKTSEASSSSAKQKTAQFLSTLNGVSSLWKSLTMWWEEKKTLN